MAIGSAVLVPLVVWPVGKLARRIRRSTEKSRARLADLSQILQETISGNRVVKAFGMEGFEIRKFREASRNLLRENMRWIRALPPPRPMMDMLGAVVIVHDFAVCARRNQGRAHDHRNFRGIHICAVSRPTSRSSASATSTSFSCRRWESRRRFSVPRSAGGIAGCPGRESAAAHFRKRDRIRRRKFHVRRWRTAHAEAYQSASPARARWWPSWARAARGRRRW